MATEQITKGARADRRISKLVTFYESRLSRGDEQVQMQGAERLADILMKQLELKDRQAERQLKRDLAVCNKRVTPTTPTPTPQSLDETIKQLRLEMARKKATGRRDRSVRLIGITRSRRGRGSSLHLYRVRLPCTRVLKMRAVEMMFEKDPTKHYVEPVVKVFGKGGPSRMWSPVSTPGAKMPNCDVGFGDLGGFTGSYVCQRCEKKCDGVYRVAGGKWVCGSCRSLGATEMVEEDAHSRLEPLQERVLDVSLRVEAPKKGPTLVDPLRAGKTYWHKPARDKRGRRVKRAVGSSTDTWTRTKLKPRNVPCGYCSQKWATGYDHLVPWSFSQDNSWENLFPSCIGCNVLLSNTMFATLEEKKAHVEKRLRERGEWIPGPQFDVDGNLLTMSGIALRPKGMILPSLEVEDTAKLA